MEDTTHVVAFDITVNCSCGANYVISGAWDTEEANDWADGHEHEGEDG